MPQLQTLVLKDRATTPVDHTYAPREISNGVGTVVESTGVPIGDNRFTISLKKLQTGKFRATLLLAVPVVQNQVVNGVTSPVIVRTAYAECSFTFDPTSTEQERKDLVGLFQSSLDPTKILVNDTVVKLQGVY